MLHANLQDNRKRAGFTLAEVITSMLILALIIGAIFAFEISAARVTAKSSRTYRAETRAGDALRTIVREMKEGIYITVAQSDVLEYAYPATEAGTRYFKMPIEVGHLVRYYRGDESGNASSGGAYLWRGDNASGAMRPTKLLSDNVHGFSLTYHYPDGSSSPDAVTVEVSTRISSHGKTELATYSSTVKLRNYGMLGV